MHSVAARESGDLNKRMCRPYPRDLSITAPLSHRHSEIVSATKETRRPLSKTHSIGVVSLEKVAQNQFAGRCEQSSREVVRKKDTAEEKELEGIDNH